MTVSRKESEMVLLQMVAEGDGELVPISDLQQREMLILKDLLDGGYIQGTMHLDGSGSYRITASGEKYLIEVESELRSDEIVILLPPDHTNWFLWLWNHKKIFWSVVVASIVFIWVLLSQVLAPSRYCPMLPNGIAGWLVTCEKLIGSE